MKPPHENFLRTPLLPVDKLPFECTLTTHRIGAHWPGYGFVALAASGLPKMKWLKLQVAVMPRTKRLKQWFPTWGSRPQGVAEKLCGGRDNPAF